MEKPETGMNLTTIQTHTTDFAIMLAGRLTSLAVLTTIQYPQLQAGDPPQPYHRARAARPGVPVGPVAPERER